MADVLLDRVSRVFAGGVAAVSDLSLSIADGEWISVVGPSGSGKTTTLRLIAGLERPTSGSIRLHGVAVNELPPHKRNVAFVFQHDALSRARTLRGNLALGWKLGRGLASDFERRVEELAALFEIRPLLDRFPEQVSGGERQRAALARALLRSPAVCLLDEPLSSLDPSAKDDLRRLLARVRRQTGMTTIHVTHDQAEALALADRVVVLEKGKLQQVGAPRELVERPANLFVARFIGHPPMNLWHGKVIEEDGRREFVHGIGRWPCPAALASCGHGADVWLGVRPEAVRDLVDGELECGNRKVRVATVEVEQVEYQGADQIISGKFVAENVADRAVVRWQVSANERVKSGERRAIEIDLNQACGFAANDGRKL